MRKIVVGAQVSIEGFSQAPGGPTEDPTKGFAFGGWLMPYRCREDGEELDRVFEEKLDLLPGRKTYEIFAAYWPYQDESAPHGRIAGLVQKVQEDQLARSWCRRVARSASGMLTKAAHGGTIPPW